MTWLVIIVIYALLVAGWWMIFTKAGEDGWKALIPIWNTLIILKIVDATIGVRVLGSPASVLWTTAVETSLRTTLFPG